MPLYASWVHGNAVTVETPESLDRVGHFAWGGDMAIKPGKASWFHIPIPTPVIVNDVRTQLHRVFLLFDAVSGRIANLHVYDGSSKVQEFEGIDRTGEHRIGLDNQNTFDLAEPHTVAFGIGISSSS